MWFEPTAVYTCPACGMTERAKAIDYDVLGYPVCPVCGGRQGPLAGSSHGVNPRA